MRIKGSNIIVTGGAGGIGSALIRRLIERDANLVACVDLPTARIAPLEDDINAGRVSCHLGDATNPDFVWQVFKLLSQACDGKPPDVLVNLMGNPLDALMEQYKPGSEPKIFTRERLMENLLVNAVGPALWANVFACYHDKWRQDCGLGNWADQGGPERGVVVFVGSVSAEVGIVGQLGYCMAKNALLGAFRVFRNECYLRLGLRPALVHPGFIETPMVTRMPEHIQESVKRNIPRKAFLSVDEIVQTLIYAIESESLSEPISVGAGYTCPPRLYRS